MQDSRLDIRLKPDTKERIRQAAQLRNQSVTQFVVSTLSGEADRVLSEQERMVLSDRDRDLFLKLLDSPPAPNKALRRAATRYKKQTARRIGLSRRSPQVTNGTSSQVDTGNSIDTSVRSPGNTPGNISAAHLWRFGLAKSE